MNSIETIFHLIKEGNIIAIKGIGGYHLCCNACDKKAVKKLRDRKKRRDKPFAIMARDISSVEKICEISPKEKEVLLGKEKPIVLLKKKMFKDKERKEIVPEIVAPSQTRLGIMLPYTYVQKRLFEYDIEFLIMTSANISGAPICYKDKDAREMLHEIADDYLIHNNDIPMPLDDSVVRVVANEMMISRCGRGYAPYVFPIATDYEILAVGSEQKSSICLVKDGASYLSQYLGDVKDYRTYRIYTYVTDYMKTLFNSNPTIYVHDLNLDFLSTQYAKKQQGLHIPIQHHHAHMASCMGEHQLWDDAIGVIFDGTGLGTDGTVWGGEFFIGSRGKFHRAGHLQYITFQGGDKVMTQLWRNALCYLYKLGLDGRDFFTDIDRNSIALIYQALENNIHCFQSSSMGRLFDCVAALVGLRNIITYDAQGAIELESQIDQEIDEYYEYEIDDTDSIVLGYETILRGIIEDIKEDVPIPIISAKFHNSIIQGTISVVCKIRDTTGCTDVVLSGGVFENTYLLENIYYGLKKIGFNPYYNIKSPINDGGISYGQVVIADSLIRGGRYVPCDSSKNN